MTFSKIQSMLRWATAGLLAVALTACVKEDIADFPGSKETPEGKLLLQLFTNSGDFTTPVTQTRGIEDPGPDATWVFVFTKAADAPDHTFSEVAQAETTDGKTFVKLTPTTVSTRLLIIANAPETFHTGTEAKTWDKDNLQALLKPYPESDGKTLAQADDLLLATLLATPQQSELPYFHPDGWWMPELEVPIPMSVVTPPYTAGIKNIASIGTDSESGKILLKRIVAKIDVKLDSSITGISYSYGLVGAPRTGSLFSENNSNNFVTTGGMTEYLKTQNGKKETVAEIYYLNWTIKSYMPLYVYESQNESISVILKITRYSPSTETFYYRVAFVDAVGTRLNIERNKYYTFTVTAINGPGYKTLEEAIAGPVSNINYTLQVVDLNSHDIVSNGQYFLSTSNSELLVYHKDASVTVDAFTLTTDALSSYFDAQALTDGKVAKIAVTKGVGMTVSPGTINLAASSSSPAVTNVQVSLTSEFKFYNSANLYDDDKTNDEDGYGEITVSLGTLTKTIKIYRYPAMTYTGMHLLPGKNYISGEITNRGENESWLSLWAGWNDCTDKFVLQQPRNVYMVAPNNIYLNDGSELGDYRQGGEFYLARQGVSDAGRVKVSVMQDVLINELPQNTLIEKSYIGAFWRADETGERLIRIPYTNLGEDSWTATVIYGQDWITLDDKQVSFTSFPPTDMDAENYQIVDGSDAVGGLLSVNSTQSPDYIYFRIGLESEYTPTEAAPARYGLVLLSYANHTKYHRIYIRQGENADYIYKDRPYSRKVSPYNLTAQTFLDQIEAEKSGASMSDAIAYEDIDETNREFTFTQFPTQAGAHFQQYYPSDGYVLAPADQYKRRAFHPTLPSLPTGIYDGTRGVTYWGTKPENTIPYWDDLLARGYETCPQGYHRPNDGLTDGDQSGYIHDPDPRHPNPDISEIQCSLWAKNDGSLQYEEGIAWGYYADGFFDRREIANHSVDRNKTSVAYAGALFFNEATYHSIFFPAAGQRMLSASYDELNYGGEQGHYASTSGALAYDGDMSMWYLLIWKSYDNNWAGYASPSTYLQSRQLASSIRCVANVTP